MSDPVRLLDLEGKGALNATERSALVEARASVPPAGIRRDVWNGLVAILPSMTAGGVGGGAGAVGNATAAASAAAAASATAAASAAAAESGGTAGTGSGVFGGVGAVGTTPWGVLATMPLVKVLLIGAAMGGTTLGVRFTASAIWPSSGTPVEAFAEEQTEAAKVGQGRAKDATRRLAPSSRDSKGREREAEPFRAEVEASNLGGSPVNDPSDRPTNASPSVLRSRAQPPSTLLSGAVPSRPRPSSDPASSDLPSGEPPSSGSQRLESNLRTPETSPSGAANPILADLREESQMIARARDLLRSGQPREALTLLDRLRSRFPMGVLVQEREALAIGALVGAGQRAAAVERARAFIGEWPESPYAARVRALVTMP